MGHPNPPTNTPFYAPVGALAAAGGGGRVPLAEVWGGGGGGVRTATGSATLA